MAGLYVIPIFVAILIAVPLVAICVVSAILLLPAYATWRWAMRLSDPQEPISQSE